LVDQINSAGINLEYFDIGGGLGIIYDEERPQTAKDFAASILPLIKKRDFKIILEPGRFIAGNAGILAAKVLYIKESYRKQFVIVDAAMNDLIRPSLYNAYHKIVNLSRPPQVLGRRSQIKDRKLVDVVGPICESGDFLGKSRILDAVAGDYIAVMSAGAYGFSMSSNYNSRPRPAEVLVDGSKYYLIREREDYKDLVRKEKIIKI
jgi:diaminopimelate decarboxylase